MNFNVDSYIKLGEGHNICEDYALEGTLFENELAYIIISDGCTSSPKTDIGSRIMALSAEKAIKNAFNDSLIDKVPIDDFIENIKRDTIFYAKNTVNQFGLPYYVCDATLLIAITTQKEYFIFAYGDGNIIIKYTDGTYRWCNINYESNAPFYLTYEMSVVNKQRYMTLEKLRKPRTEKTITYAFFKGSEISKQCTSSEPEISYARRGEIKDIEFISLSSDGIETFNFSSNKIEKPTPEETLLISTPDAVLQTVAYKKTQGKFVKRRMDRLSEDMKKIQAEHFDDISSATIMVNHAS